MSVFYTVSSLFGGFSSVMSGGITDLTGKRGLNGWQWIFVKSSPFIGFIKELDRDNLDHYGFHDAVRCALRLSL
jgi:hypothetical protein